MLRSSNVMICNADKQTHKCSQPSEDKAKEGQLQLKQQKNADALLQLKNKGQ